MTTSDSSIQGTWIVTSYRRSEVMVDPDDRTGASLTIDGTLVVGSMGVNRFSAQMDAELPMGPLAITRMAGPPELMLQEDTSRASPGSRHHRSRRGWNDFEPRRVVFG